MLSTWWCRLTLEPLEGRHLPSGAAWSDFGHDAQHSGLSDVASRALDEIRWQTPEDTNFDLSTHEGSPVITPANTVIVPVHTSTGYRLEGHRGSDGAVLWTQTSDYTGSNFAPVLTPQGRVYFPGAGGTVYYCDDPDARGATTTGQLAFYGIGDYTHALDSAVHINTPMTADRTGTIHFGFVASTNALNLQSGIARMDVNGNGTWIAASTAAGDTAVTQVADNCGPALSNDGRALYVATLGGLSYLVSLDTTTLQPLARTTLLDPKTLQPAGVTRGSSATPLVGPDGDVYFGVQENPYGSNEYRGWMLHFSADLSQTKIPGVFGWDTTGSIVPSRLVPSYTGSSSYLLATKYNKYNQGVYQIGLLDPNASMVDPYTGATVMNEVETVNGVTLGREWCINDMAVDPLTGSILANSEDGHLYRWNLASNTLTENISLDSGYGEAYTPTLIGPDGTVYSINDGILFAVGSKFRFGQPRPGVSSSSVLGAVPSAENLNGSLVPIPATTPGIRAEVPAWQAPGFASPVAASPDGLVEVAERATSTSGPATTPPGTELTQDGLLALGDDLLVS
jgi:hypothetical protein